MARSAASLPARAGGFLSLGSAGDDAKHFFFAHDDVILVIQLDFGAGVFSEEDAVPFFHIEGADLAFFVDFAFAGGDDLALLRLVFGGVGDDDSATGGFSFFYATDENPV